MDAKPLEPTPSLLIRVLEWVLRPLAHQPFLDRARTGFFFFVVSIAAGLILFSLITIALKGHWSSLIPEALVLLFLAGLLVMIWKGLAEVASGLLSILVPLAFDLRFGQDTDYLLAFAAATLVTQTLVSSRVRFLLVTGAVFGLGGAVSLIDGELVLHPALQVRYLVILAFLTVVLALLQWVVGQATKRSTDSEARLRLVLDERTAKLGVANEKLDRARRSLASGEKLFSLGRLIAGVAHQVNTPLAAVNSSQAHLQNRLAPVVRQWAGLGRALPPSVLEYVWEFSQHCCEDWPLPSSREGRELRTKLEAQLRQLEAPDLDIKAELLAELGVATLDKDLLALLALPSAVEVLQALLELVQLKRSLVIVAAATEKASSHVLALSRFATPAGAVRVPETVDLIENLETVLDVYRSQIPESLRLVCRLPSEKLEVSGHAEQLMLVWSNLLTNARQALQDHGTITVDLEIRASVCEIRICDTGPGIPEVVQLTLLQPFQIGRSSHDNERISLGLQIVLNILERHEGSLAFDSVPGNTVFKVTLPHLVTAR